MKETIRKRFDNAGDTIWYMFISAILIGLIIVLAKYCYIPGGIIDNQWIAICDTLFVLTGAATMTMIQMLITWIVINIKVRKMKH